MMDQSAEDIKEHLMRTSEDFRHLSDQHRSLKKQVAQLEGKPFLTEQEEVEEQRLKKLKLHLKDQMEAMISEYRPESVTSAV